MGELELAWEWSPQSGERKGIGDRDGCAVFHVFDFYPLACQGGLLPPVAQPWML